MLLPKFCHIAPVEFLFLIEEYPQQLLLAHLIDDPGKDNMGRVADTRYLDFYKNYKGLKILDNSAFEMYKQNRPMFTSDRLLAIAKQVNAHYIVMSDYPNCDASKTITAAEELAPKFKDAGVGTFFCPQSKIGDLDSLCASFAWAAQSSLVDYIGVSILSVPNAYGVESNNKLQRYLSRYAFMKELEYRGIMDQIKENEKLIHFLGMVDGPNEIQLLRDSGYLSMIDTWDSSAAVWAGLNGIKFDNSPTGLINGKFETEVEFLEPFSGKPDLVTAESNMKYIDKLLEGY